MNLVNFYTSFHDPIWVVILSAALFFPVRQLIWVLYVRKKQNPNWIVKSNVKFRNIHVSYVSILISYDEITLK